MVPDISNPNRAALKPEAPPSRSRGPWLLLLVGILIYVGVQGYLTVSPLQNWTLTPEIKDGLTYVLKSQQMLECFQQDCPALIDLHDQLFGKAGDSPVSSEAYKQRALAVARVFPVYHPLFSGLLIGIAKLGHTNLLEAYRVLWTLFPLILALAFAAWLTSMFGPGVAGVALILLAFKVFPDTGLHHLVPSNLTMALAVLLWARIIARRGWAPWSLALGSMVLVTMHLIGVIYAAMAVALAMLLAGPEKRRRLFIAAGVVVGFIGAALVVAHFVKKPDFILPSLLPATAHPWADLLMGTVRNVAQMIVDNVRLSEGLWGSPALFGGALVLGLATLEAWPRRVVWNIILIYAVVLGGFLFFVSNHPGDVLFRLWIPLVVLLFGLVARAICWTMNLAVAWWRERRAAAPGEAPLDIRKFWPVIALAVLLGYSGEMIFKGAEQVGAMARFLREKVPLALYPSQPQELLAHARPGDRVLYTSFVLMDYYLIFGGLSLGAVYYHPALGGPKEPASG